MYEDGAPHAEKAVFEAGVPVLGICYGLQEIAWALGGEVLPCDKREYGHAEITVDANTAASALFHGLGENMKVCASSAHPALAS